MNKIYYAFLLFLLLPFFELKAQSGLTGINYQAVARKLNGTVVANEDVSVRISILGGSPDGTVQYQETHSVTTNQLGLFTLQIGKGTPNTGTFTAVPWANADQFLKVEASVGSGSFTVLGTTQLMSVPFSLYAANGNPGPVGPAGPVGAKGDAGVPGPQGIPGAIGPVGITGAKGDAGVAGPQGLPGAIGPVGPAGVKGDAGVAGIQGIPGAIGPVGPAGIKGDAGVAGPAGIQGLPGAIGPVGPAGIKGDAGVAGPAGIQGLPGAIGPVGPAGIKGDAGVAGPAGIQGLPGPIGIPGAVGPIGPAGATGPQGIAGPAGDINGVAAGGALTGTYPNPGIANGVITAAKLAAGVIPTALPPNGAASGDLSGTYPAPAVAKLQGQPVSATVPTNGQFLKFNGTDWAPSSGGGGGLTLPYATTENNAATLFSITNDGDGTSLEGVSNATTSSIAALRGIVTSAAPGGFSSAVRGINSGNGGLGIGIWGSQAGSGWGVYGVTPNGLGVYGNSSGAGTGVYANSNNGTGLSATSTNGLAANISILNNANANTVLTVSTLGSGIVADLSTGGTGEGLRSSTADGFSVHGVTTSHSSAAIVGDNTSGGEAIVGRTTSNDAAAVVGRNDGGGFGVRGFISTNTDNTGVGVQGEVGSGGSTGLAGRFNNTNTENTEVNTFEVNSNTKGNIPNNALGNAASFFLDNTGSVGAAVRGEVNTIYGNFGAASIFGVSSGTGGRAGLFYSSNTTGNGAAIVALTDGNGNAITANAGKNGNAVEANVDGTGDAVYGWIPSFGTGRAAHFENFNEDNVSDALTVTTIGNATAGSFKVDRTTGTSPAVKGEVNSQFANFGTAGIYGLSSGTGGFGGLFYSSNAAGNGPALIALTEGNGNGLTANAGKNGHGVEANCDGSGNAIYGWIPNFGIGKAGRFANFNDANGNPTVHISNEGTGTALLVNHNGTSGNPAVFQSAGTNVARINKAGKGFFNGGTQSSGADVAEAFAVTGGIQMYAPGDVLVIAEDADRTVALCAVPYSSMVAGVYATKPGVLLTEEDIDTDISDKVPMGVIGVIPTKVCGENGPIKRGDLLVTSSKAGHAMKADIDKVKPGQVIGKALENFDGQGTGKIRVLVNVR
jgi:hypothetical protein